MSKQGLREESKKQWAPCGVNPTLEELALGAQLRIADATEKMAVNHDKLIRDVEFYKDRYKHYQRCYNAEQRTNSALKGHITRLKNKLKG